jgi:hypothetical protein
MEEVLLTKEFGTLTIETADGKFVCSRGNPVTLRGMFGVTVSVRNSRTGFRGTVRRNGTARKFCIASNRSVSFSV